MRFLVLAVFLAAAAAAAEAGAQERIQVNLREDTVIQGISVSAGPAEIFVPGGELASGRLAADAQIMRLELPAGARVDMQEPRRLRRIELPNARDAYLIADAPFRGGSVIGIQYTEYYAKLGGQLVAHPEQFAEFPNANLNAAVFANSVSANCTAVLRHLDDETGRGFQCNFGLTLAASVEQAFGTQVVDLPAGTHVSFARYGVESLRLAQDAYLLGLPVSAAELVRVNRYTDGLAPSIMSLHLARDAEYQNLPLAAGTQVEFYGPDGYGYAPLRSFLAPRPTLVPGGAEEILVAAQKTVHLYANGRLHYGDLAESQTVQGIQLPAGAMLSLSETGRIRLVALAPRSQVTIAGVTYQNNNLENGRLYLDFNEEGMVIRVRP